MKTKLKDGQIMLLLLLGIAGLWSVYLFKASAIFIIAILSLWGLKIVGLYDSKFNFLSRFSFAKNFTMNIVLFLWSSAFFAMFFSSNLLVSGFGSSLVSALKTLLNTFGTIVLLLLPIAFFAWKFYKNKNILNPQPALGLTPAIAGFPVSLPETGIKIPKTNVEPPKTEIESPKTDIETPDTKPKSSEKEPKPTITTQLEETIDAIEYQFPGLDLLIDYPTDNEQDILEEVESRKKDIEKAFKDFEIGNIVEINATVGATVTLYLLKLARGVASSKILAHEQDLARILEVPGIRIISPYKDTGCVAIETPRKQRQIVGIKSVLSSKEFRNCDYELPLALGRTVDGEAKIIDLTDAKKPHQLVAGSTGQGKSVGLNAMICSLLYKKHPNELKFLFCDPKHVELSIYENIKDQYLVSIPDVESPILTDDTDEISTALLSLCEEVEQRLLKLKQSKCRSIKEYNAIQRANNKRILPHIVCVIDEFADLILAKNKDIEEALIRLARKGRAAGICLIVATQRPCVKAIPGTIRANFPGRIAYKVNKRVESQIILDSRGAETLVGDGDMLLYANGELERVQGALVETEEVNCIVDFIAEQGYVAQKYVLPKPKIT